MGIVLSLWATVVVGRLVQVQLVRHDDYNARAADQQQRTISLTPVRGSIRDARGRILAESIPADSVYADPQAVQNPQLVAQRLSAVLGMRIPDIEKKLKARNEFAWIARQVSPEVGAQVRKLKLPGIYTLEEHRRSYPRGALAANVLGYVNLDGVGIAGIEHSFDHHVQGQAGKVTLLRDARRGMYLMGGGGKNAARDGSHVVLTIDEVIQFIAERALKSAVEKYRAASGSVVVMDPRDGAILAMASAPTFDPNDFRKFTPADWRNRAVQDFYEPGSTFKIVTAAAGLEEGLVTPSQMIDCNNGGIQIANVRIKEHGGHAYGVIPFEEVLVHSSNVGTIRVGLALGSKRLYRYVRAFGFGEKSGIELPGETSGMLRRTERWSQLSNAVISIGQEMAATPLQVTRAVAAIANGGMLPQPKIVQRVIDSNGKTIYEAPTDKSRRVVSARTAAVLNEMLKAVVERGTGKSAALAEHVVAGKTGTAQKPGRGGYSSDVVASFAGYVPADRPRLVILVAVDTPRGAQYGGTIAAPVFQEVAQATLRYLEVPPSIPARELTLKPPVIARLQRTAPVVVRASHVVVPDFRGLDARDAISRATNAGLAVGAEGSGFVRLQKPLPGIRVRRGEKISLQMGVAGVGV